jgi:hypothetical protein
MGYIFMRLLIGIVIIVQICFSYPQSIHQHITREAFKLLQYSFPTQLSEMAGYIGASETSSSATSDLTWGDGKIVSGAWIEDEYDVVYHYGIGSLPNLDQTLQNALTNVFGDQRKTYTFITHFWDADAGRTAHTQMSDNAPVSWSFNIPENAYLKARSYVDGAYSYREIYSTVRSSVCFSRAVRSDWHSVPLLAFYHYDPAHIYQAYSYLDATGQTNSATCSIKTDMPARAYEILGRICHLLQDMAIPEHVHNEEHACQSGMRCSFYENNCQNYHQWTAAEIWGRGLGYINPFFDNGTDADPIYNLMYLMNQITDHYASTTVKGDDSFNSGFPFLNDIFPVLGMPRESAEINDANCRSMHDVLETYAIRLTAGLLYWFSVKTGKLPYQPYPDNTDIAPASLSAGDCFLYMGKKDLNFAINGTSFILPSGANATAYAGNFITLYPGFQAQAGSIFSAVIDAGLTAITYNIFRTFEKD